MRIEERGCSMITDKQGREWLLQKLYDDGWQYCVMDNFDNLYLINEEPSMFDDEDKIRISSCKRAMGASAFKNILPKLNRNECISIAEELGIVDWSKVKVDTPVLVRDFENQDWKKRYFAFFDDELIYTWDGGATSWSVKNKDAMPWKYAKLAEV